MIGPKTVNVLPFFVSRKKKNAPALHGHGLVPTYLLSRLSPCDHLGTESIFPLISSPSFYLWLMGRHACTVPVPETMQEATDYACSFHLCMKGKMEAFLIWDKSRYQRRAGQPAIRCADICGLSCPLPFFSPSLPPITIYQSAFAAYYYATVSVKRRARSAEQPHGARNGPSEKARIPRRSLNNGRASYGLARLMWRYLPPTAQEASRPGRLNEVGRGR
jgi:hypothetical protein